MRKNMKEKGYYYSKQDSPYFKINGGRDYMNIFGTLLRGLLQFLQFLLIFMIIKSAIQAGISVSVCISLISMTPFMTAIAFFFLYKEKLTIRHVIGMIFMISCVLVISFA